MLDLRTDLVAGYESYGSTGKEVDIAATAIEMVEAEVALAREEDKLAVLERAYESIEYAVKVNEGLVAGNESVYDDSGVKAAVYAVSGVLGLTHEDVNTIVPGFESGMVDKVKDFLKRIWEAIKNTAKKVWEFLTGLVKKVVSFVKGIAGSDDDTYRVLVKIINSIEDKELANDADIDDVKDSIKEKLAVAGILKGDKIGKDAIEEYVKTLKNILEDLDSKDLYDVWKEAITLSKKIEKDEVNKEDVETLANKLKTAIEGWNKTVPETIASIAGKSKELKDKYTVKAVIGIKGREIRVIVVPNDKDDVISNYEIKTANVDVKNIDVELLSKDDMKAIAKVFEDNRDAVKLVSGIEKQSKTLDKDANAILETVKKGIDKLENSDAESLKKLIKDLDFLVKKITPEVIKSQLESSRLLVKNTAVEYYVQKCADKYTKAAKKEENNKNDKGKTSNKKSNKK